MLLIVGPCTFIPALILYLKAPGIDPTALFKGKLGSSGHAATEVFRCNIFLSLLFYGIAGLNLMCFVIPQVIAPAPARHDGDCFMQVRKYFVATGGLLVMMLLGGAFMYESTLVKDVSVISQYVKQRPKSTGAAAGGGPEVTLGSGLVYVAERLLLALMIVTLFMGVERLLLERIKVAYYSRHGTDDEQAATAKDVHILKRLHAVLRVVFFVIGGVVAAPFFDFGTARLWVTYGVLMATLGFMLKGAARTAFEALILVFVRHPYDVGDEVVIEGMVTRLKVTEIKMFTTQFEKREEDGAAAAAAEILYIPNARIMDKSVANITRHGSRD